MFRFTRFLIFLSIVLLGAFTVAKAQTPQRDNRPRTASVSGRVTIAGKPAVNAKVVITEVNDRSAPGNHVVSMDLQGSGAGEDYVALTDAEGRYRATNLPEGKYEAHVSLGGCVREKPSPNASLMESFSLSEGASRENVDFALVRGGVITGRVTDADGRPLIARAVGLQVVDEGGQKRDARIQDIPNWMMTVNMFQTDDRGVYRIFGLRAGRYVVSAGGDSNMGLATGAGAEFARVWHPDATDENQAKVIEVTAGGEVTGVDIRLGVAKKSYEASGRVVDDETGKPIAGASVIYTKSGGSGESVSFSLPVATPKTDEQGNFHFSGLTPGQYRLSLSDFASFLTGGGSGYYSDGAKFELQSADVAGVEIRAKRGATISGVAVIEDADQSARSGLSQTMIMAYSMPSTMQPSPNEVDENPFASAMTPVGSRIGNDGGFTLKGIRPGKVMIQAFNMNGAALNITRIERGGVETMNEIMVTEREEISGVRIVFGKGSCVIRGQVNVTGGVTLKDWRMSVTASSEKEGVATLFGSSARSTEVDDKGRFVIEGLLPGEYQLTLMARSRGDTNSPPAPNDGVPAPVTQKVVVTKGQEAQVTMTLDLSNKNREEK
jgi:protocatechuate 3,4-dioxygenase beta subunit